MTHNPAIVSLFDKYGYAVRRTDPDTYYQNYPDEVPHIYTGKSGRSLMEGHKDPLKIWTYDFSHYIKVHGMVLHGESELSSHDFFL